MDDKESWTLHYRTHFNAVAEMRPTKSSTPNLCAKKQKDRRSWFSHSPLKFDQNPPKPGVDKDAFQANGIAHDLLSTRGWESTDLSFPFFDAPKSVKKKGDLNQFELVQKPCQNSVTFSADINDRKRPPKPTSIFDRICTISSSPTASAISLSSPSLI